MLRTVKRKVVKHGQTINLGCFRIEFIKTNHSIQDAAALAIFSPAGIVVHTGDFKVDYTPVFGDADRSAAVCASSERRACWRFYVRRTNAERPGFTHVGDDGGKRRSIDSSPSTSRHQDHRSDLCLQCGPGTADHQLRLQVRQKSRCGGAEHGQCHRDRLGAGLSEHPGRIP